LSIGVTSFRTRAHPLPAFVVALWLLGSGCQRGPGSPCEKGEARCLDGARALVCEAGKFVETPCRGKAGCSTTRDPSGEATACDISGNRPGDRCSRDEEGVSACLAPDTMLACRNGKFELVGCRGARGCEASGSQTSCDQSLGQAGDACTTPKAKACAVDGSAALWCEGGSLVELYACRGEKRCSAAGGKLNCDQTTARAGDRCDRRLDGHIACSEDRKQLLVCRAERFQLSEKCKPNSECLVSGKSTSCAGR
jgi:hypothetical protein